MVNDLLDVLLNMRSGQVACDISQKFDDVLKSVLDTGRKGELTIKLNLQPSKMGMGGVVLEVEMDHEVKLKKPELPIGSAVFFVNTEGRLTRDDPAQTAMFAVEQTTQLEREK